METFVIEGETARDAGGSGRQAIIGVVASGNLEILVERTEPARHTRIEVSTAAHGFRPVWEAVIADFIERASPGGLLLSINDGGARPDTVALRLMQAVRLLEREP